MTAGRVVAVTGATGFLGVHLVAALAREDAKIRILARHREHDLWRGIDLDLVPGRLDDGDALARLVAGADTVVHIAGLIKAQSRAAFMRTNGEGTRAIADATRRHAPAARFIAISSLAAREPQVSDYAASKRAGEDAACSIYADAPDRLVILRPPAIYGPWDRETLAIFKAASQPVIPVFGRGLTALMHVTDAAAAVTRLAMGAGAAGLYALADDNPSGYRMIDLLGEAARAVGNANPRFIRLPGVLLLAAGKVAAGWGRLGRQTPIFTAGKAREMLHPDWAVSLAEMLPPEIYRSKLGISDGFRETVDWYKAAGWLR